MAASVAILIVAEALAQTTLPPPQSPPALSQSSVPASGTGAPPPTQEVHFSGNASLLRAANPWWGTPVLPCSTFRVSAAPSITTIVLYTNGLGRTLRAPATSEKGADCRDVSAFRDRVDLPKDKPDVGIDKFVSIKIDPDLLSTPGASVQGNVVAIAGTRKLGEFALKVERLPQDLWTALTWVLSVLVPAIITLGVARGAIWLDARRKAAADFREFRLANMAEVIAFLKAVDVAIRSGLEHPGQTVLELAINRGMLGKMSRAESDRFQAACRADDEAKIVRAVKKLFPEFKTQIDTLETSLRTREQKNKDNNQ